MQMKKVGIRVGFAFVACSTIAACVNDAPTALTASVQQSAQSRSVCQTPTIVVNDEASLHAAAASAQAGDVIGVHGVIQLAVGVELNTPDVTITCAEPGAGLAFAAAAAPDDALLWVLADRISVRGLFLDATKASWSIYSFANDGQRSEFNTIRCGSQGCAFWVSSTNALVANNSATMSIPGASGFHFQTGIDGTRIEHNTIVATVDAGLNSFGGMRPRDGSNVTITDNVISGPWSNSISSVNLNDSDLSHNSLSDARRYGLAVNIAGQPQVVFSRGDRVVSNVVRNAGIAAFVARNACSNSFLGNAIAGITPLGFDLQATTGDNHIAGSSGVVIDAGAYDCDGDGVNDPNKVTGNATVVGASSVGSIAGLTASAVSDAGSATASKSRFPELR
jgi:hypothetical protein